MQFISRPSRGPSFAREVLRSRGEIAALLGGSLNVAIAVVAVPRENAVDTIVGWETMVAQALATALMFGGLWAVHRRYGGEYGLAGRIVAAVLGLGLAWLTLAMGTQGVVVLLGLRFEAPGRTWFLVNLLSMVVATAYGLVLWRNGVLGWGGVAMAATLPFAVAILGIMALSVGELALAFWVPLGLAWVAVGVAMLRDRSSVARPTAEASA